MNEWNQFIVIALVGLPLAVVFGGPYAWRGLIILLALGLFASHPIFGFMLLGIYVLRAPIRWAAEGFIFGAAGGAGLRASGFLRRLSKNEKNHWRISWARVHRWRYHLKKRSSCRTRGGDAPRAPPHRRMR